MPLPRRAARVQVEQLRSDVADALRRPRPRLLPLVAAELVQRRALGRRARVAGDEVERVHRHVEAVAARVLEREELVRRAAGLERCEPDEAADAVVLVHDGSARAQIREVADDRFGIAVGTAAGTLPRALADELLLDDESDAGVRQDEPALDRRHGDADRLVLAQEVVPARHLDGMRSVRTQCLGEQLAAARRFRDEECAAVEVEQEVVERVQRLFRLPVHREPRRRRGLEVVRGSVVCLGRELEALDVYALVPLERVAQLLRRDEGFRRRKHRSLDVVRELRVARLDLAVALLRRSARVAELRDPDARRQVIEERGRALEEEREVVLDAARCNAGRHVAIDLRALRITFESLAIVAAEEPDGALTERNLAAGQQLDTIALLARALRLRGRSRGSSRWRRR
jgi:hypothetical protein